MQIIITLTEGALLIFSQIRVETSLGIEPTTLDLSSHPVPETYKPNHDPFFITLFEISNLNLYMHI